MPRLDRTATRIILALLTVAIFCAIVAVRSCQSSRTADATAALATGQAGAAQASGRDAVDTVGNRAATDAGTDTITKETTDAIRHAPGSDAPINPAARDAGLAGLCRYAAYQHDPRCVQHADP